MQGKSAESIGISNWLWTPATPLSEEHQGALSAIPGLALGVVFDTNLLQEKFPEKYFSLFWTLKVSGKARLFQGIAREIRVCHRNDEYFNFLLEK